MDSGEFLSGDAMLSHAIQQHRAMQRLLDEAIQVVAENTKRVHGVFHKEYPHLTWEECGHLSCMRAQGLKHDIEEMCGVKT